MPAAHLSLKQLRAVQAVYASRRISAAAETLNVTQSAVSVLIRQAEAALGAPLFDRTTRSLVPTIAAERAIGIIERMLADLGTLDATMTELRDLARGQLRLTATPATGMALLPATVRRFRAAYPGITLVLDDCAPNQFFSIIREEKAEFGVGTPPADRAEFDWQLVHDDPLCLICPADHPLGGREAVNWAELADLPLIVSRRDYGVRDLVEATLAQLAIRPRIVAEIGFFGTAAWMTEVGIGLCVLPGMFARTFGTSDLRVVPLQSPRVSRPAAVVTRRGRTLSPAAARFVEMLLEDFAPLR